MQKHRTTSARRVAGVAPRRAARLRDRWSRTLALAAPAQAQGDGTAVHTSHRQRRPGRLHAVRQGRHRRVGRPGGQHDRHRRHVHPARHAGPRPTPAPGSRPSTRRPGSSRRASPRWSTARSPRWRCRPTAPSVYVGGAFNTVNGVTRKKVALIKVSDGSLGHGVQGHRHQLRASTTCAASATRCGSPASSPTSAARRAPALVTLERDDRGAHRPEHAGVRGAPQRRHARTSGSSPSLLTATSCIAIGNFTTVNGLPRDQVVLLDISRCHGRCLRLADQLLHVDLRHRLRHLHA